MDHGLKYKTYICKTLRKNNKWKSLGLRTRQRAPTLDTKSSVHRNKHRDIRFNQNEKASALWKTPFRGWKESWDWRKKKKANHTHNKGPLPRIYKASKFNSKKPYNPIRK